RSPHQVKRRLAERESLTDQHLAEADHHLQRIPSLLKLAQSLLDATGMIARLVEMLLQAIAIGAARRHRNLRLQDADQPDLAGMRLVQVLHDFLVGLTHPRNSSSF